MYPPLRRGGIGGCPFDCSDSIGRVGRCWAPSLYSPQRRPVPPTPSTAGKDPGQTPGPKRRALQLVSRLWKIK